MIRLFEEIYSHAPKWRELVNAKKVELLNQKISLDLNIDSIDIYNASWCPDCERETVELMALLLLNSSPVKISIHSYEDLETYKENKKEGVLPIKCLPTFIFSTNDKEVVRIEENSNGQLLQILRNLN